MGKPRRLNRERVIARAVTLANEAGQLEAVTLTALAAQLSIRPPSLYNHVANLGDLHRGIAAYGVAALNVTLREAALGQVGREALPAMAHAYRHFAHTNRGIYPLLVGAPADDDHELQSLSQELIHLLLLVLASIGLTGEPALHAVRGFRSILHGFVDLEMRAGFKLALDIDSSFQSMLDNYLAGIV